MTRSMGHDICQMFFHKLPEVKVAVVFRSDRDSITTCRA